MDWNTNFRFLPRQKSKTLMHFYSILEERGLKLEINMAINFFLSC
mgnify:FL=1